VKKFNLRSGLMATTTIAGALATTAGVTALVSTVAALAPTAAEAQDYTSGALIGSVTANGAPVAGASVTLTSKALGQTTHLTTTTSGSFSATGLQPGEYDITVSAQGYADYHSTAKIVISQEVRFEAALSTVGATQTVVVKGHRVRQDFTKTTTGLTVDLDTLVAQEPIARNLTAVTMLAPTVTQGNPGFGNVASFGGGSVAENAYYVDGLNVTNPDTYIGSAKVPFDFYKTIEVKTGGYQAEFGRATGGVVNATTKSGTNDFMFAVHGNYQPAGLRDKQLDTYANRGAFETVKNNSMSVEAGGALWKDHLFAYGLYQVNDYKSTAAAYRAGTYSVLKNTDPFFGFKLDGYITPTQHLSFTYFDTNNTDKTDLYSFKDSTTALHPTSHTTTIGSKNGHTDNQLGGKNWVFNYSGKVTNWFSVSAAIGDMQDKSNFAPTDLTDYYVQTLYNPTTGAYAGSATRISTAQSTTGYNIDSYERKFWRADGDIRFEFMGRHHVRFGYDDEKNSMDKITTLTGTIPVQYSYDIDPNATSAEISAGTAAKVLEVTYEKLGGHVSSQNDAFYLQDSWDLTPTLNLAIGLRDDEFKQFNLSGEQYMDLKNNVAPRLGFSWTPDADGNWKVYGSYGANYIPPAMNLGFRGKDLYFSEYFNAPAGGWSINSSTGLPSAVGSAVLGADGFTDACPASTLASAPGFNSTNAAAGVNACAVFGNGTQEGATSKTAIGLKATEEDEVILGTTFKANDLWTFGVSATYRNTKRVSEDSDFNDAIIAYLNSKGLDSSQWQGDSSYYVWNVGDHDATVRLKHILPGETTARVITLSAAQLGHYHNAKRTYEALVFDFKRAFDGKWGLQGSYTWSRLYGNYNGTVTEAGNGVQTDAGATYAWDAPGFEDNGTGLLGNDRTHTFKLFGSYAFTPAFTVGANVMVQSPEKFSCLGHHPTDSYAFSYGNVSHFCGGVAAPVGKGLKSDWTKNVDLAFRYTVPQKYSIAGKLVLRADIFNLFDYHQVLTRRVSYETTSIASRSSVYGYPTAYNAPRYTRLGFDLSY